MNYFRTRSHIVCVVVATLAIVSCGNKNTPIVSNKAETDSQNIKTTNPANGENLVKELTTDDFKTCIIDYDAHPQEWVFAGKRPAFVDFYATWCKPCKEFAPIVEEMAMKYKGKIDFYKIDVDKQPELANMFGIQSIPTLLFIPMDDTPEITMGAMSKEQFEQAIKTRILKNRK